MLLCVCVFHISIHPANNTNNERALSTLTGRQANRHANQQAGKLTGRQVNNTHSLTNRQANRRASRKTSDKPTGKQQTHHTSHIGNSPSCIFVEPVANISHKSLHIAPSVSPSFVSCSVDDSTGRSQLCLHNFTLRVIVAFRKLTTQLVSLSPCLSAYPSLCLSICLSLYPFSYLQCSSLL